MSKLFNDITEGLDLPSDSELTEDTRRAKISQTQQHKMQHDPEFRYKKTKHISEKNLERWTKVSDQEKQNIFRKVVDTKIKTLGVKYIVRSPGNDLLDYYDAYWQKLYDNFQERLKTNPDAQNNVGTVPPSLVYKIRYCTEYPAGQKANIIRQMLLDAGITLHDKHKLFYQTVERSLFPFLVTEPHQSWEFDTKTQALDFVQEQTGQNIDRPGFPEDGMMWTRDKARGWSIIRVKSSD